MSDKKFSSTAGPRQTKQVSEALSKFSWRGKARLEKFGVIGGQESSHEVVASMAPQSDDYHAAYDRLGEKYGWTITADNYKAIIADVVAATAALVLPVVDERRTPEADAELTAANNAQRDKWNAEAAAKAIEADKLEAELRVEYPWAIASDGKLSEAARAAKNLKIELTNAFPGVKFSVKSEYYSMGNSVDVKWTDGPTSDEVREISRKYSGGTFDGMTDMYEDDNSAYSKAVERVLGEAKYVSEHRNVSKEIYEAVARMLTTQQGVAYDGDNTRNVFGENDGEVLGTHVYRIISANAIPQLGKLIGIENDQDKKWWFRLDFELPIPATAPVSEPSGDGLAVTVQKHFHTKRQSDFWLVVLGDKVSRERFEELRDAAKVVGGWYSRQWGKVPGGFGFDNEADAVAFAATIEPAAAVSETTVDAKPAATSFNAQRATKLRDMADGLQAEIDNKTRDMTQGWTPMRGRQYSSRLHKGRNLERAQAAMRTLADAYEAGDVPEVLKSIRTQVKRDFLDMTETIAGSNGYYDHHDTGEYRDKSVIALALRGLVDHHKSPAEREAELAAKRKAEVDAKINDLRGADIDGFFPTPASVIDRMLDEADIETGHRVLEPSAGIGSILDKIRERHGIDAVAVEVNYTLGDILSMKGYDVERGDFLEFDRGEQYDRIVMNPPFERGADVKHVRHAFDLLAPGGRLVALMGGGAAFSKASDLIDEFGWSESLGAPFADIEAFNRTAVSVNLVVLDKPRTERPRLAETEEFPVVADEQYDPSEAEFENSLLDDSNYLAFL